MRNHPLDELLAACAELARTVRSRAEALIEAIEGDDLEHFVDRWESYRAALAEVHPHWVKAGAAGLSEAAFRAQFAEALKAEARVMKALAAQRDQAAEALKELGKVRGNLDRLGVSYGDMSPGAELSLTG